MMCSQRRHFILQFVYAKVASKDAFSASSVYQIYHGAGMQKRPTHMVGISTLICYMIK